jgi:hypothetical protein
MTSFPDVSPELGHRLASLADGEGCFVLARANAHRSNRPNQGEQHYGWRAEFRVKLRADDLPFLVRMSAATGLGRVSAVRADGRANHNPQVVWVVQRKADCLRLTEILDAYPPWSKKSRDYGYWREAVTFWAAVGGGRTDWTPMARLSAALQGVRVYDERRAVMASSDTESWLGLVERGSSKETELVTLTGLKAEPQAVIETTDGIRITLTEPAAGESPDLAAA